MTVDVVIGMRKKVATAVVVELSLGTTIFNIVLDHILERYHTSAFIARKFSYDLLRHEDYELSDVKDLFTRIGEA